MKNANGQKVIAYSFSTVDVSYILPFTTKAAVLKRAKEIAVADYEIYCECCEYLGEKPELTKRDFTDCITSDCGEWLDEDGVKFYKNRDNGDIVDLRD